MRPLRLLLLAPLLGACFLIPTDPARYGEIRVQVSDSAGVAIPGAGVEARGFLGRMAVGTTASDGGVTLDFLPFGEYEIGVFPPIGFSPLSRRDTAAVGPERTSLTFIFELLPPDSLGGGAG